MRRVQTVIHQHPFHVQTHRKRLPLDAARIFCSLFFAPLLCNVSGWAQPRPAFRELMADVGQLSVGRAEKRTVTFECRNVGTEPLVFDHTESMCPCVEVKLPKKPLKPNKTARIRVTFPARDLDDRGVVGNVISIFYNGPSQYTRIRVRAELTD